MITTFRNVGPLITVARAVKQATNEAQIMLLFSCTQSSKFIQKIYSDILDIYIAYSLK